MSSVGGATKEMAAGMSGAIAPATGIGASLGVLLPIAAAVALVAGAVYAAWSSNFMNIRGVVDSVVGGIKGMFDQMKPSISAIGTTLAPIGDVLKNIFKVAGVAVIGGVAAAAISLATALRLIVDALSAIASVAKAAFYGVEAMFQKLVPGGEDGAKALKKAGAAMKDAGTSVKDMGQAYVDAYDTGKKAIDKFGESADKPEKVAKATKVSVKEVTSSLSDLKKDVENTKYNFSDMIDTTKVSDKTKEFLTNVGKSLDTYQSNAEKAADKYKKAMVAAEKQKGAEQVAAVNEANSKLAAATLKNGQNLSNVTADLDRQLAAKRFSDGTAMTADQVKVLTEQNNQVKAKLLEQNQIYTQAQLSRIQNGQKLNQQEQTASITTLQSNYTLRQQQIATGEAKVTELKDQISKARDVTTRAQLEQELATQTAHNQQLLGQQTTFGAQMNALIANGQKLNYTTWSTGLQSMTDVTAQQLQSMFLSFASMNSDTGQQMQAFALTLQRSGTQGVGDLVKALQDGTLTSSEAAKAMSSGAVAGLQTLPDGMFKKGGAGRDGFIKALKAGDFKAAGKYLATESAKGSDDKSGQSKSGKGGGDAYSKGLKEKKQSAHDAGETLANSAKGGAKSVSLKPVGSQMAAGVASGIRGNTPEAVDAMRSLVTQVNAEAKKKADIHSPSRLLRNEVGKFLALGVAQGITDYASSASDAMGGLVGNLTTAPNLGIADRIGQMAGGAALQVASTIQANVTANSGQARTNQLLEQLLNKNSNVYVDRDKWVGATGDGYNGYMGETMENEGRWAIG